MSNIPVLEKSERGTNVLVARLGADNGLYVVERARRGVYAVSKLGRTVGEGDVFVAGKGSASGIWGEGGVGTGEAGEGKEGEWWEVARVEDPENMNLDFQSGGSKEKWRADVKVVFGKGDRPPERRGVAALDQNLSSSSDGNLNMDVDVLTPLESEGRAGGDVGEDSLQSGQELLDTLREQYLQALYVSKVSWVVGPWYSADCWLDVCCVFCERTIDALSNGVSV